MNIQKKISQLKVHNIIKCMLSAFFRVVRPIGLDMRKNSSVLIFYGNISCTQSVILKEHSTFKQLFVSVLDFLSCSFPV